MGDDTPLAVLSDKLPRLHHFFRQNFSQVTNPPIDSLRERRVMSLKTRLRQSRQHPRRGPEPEPRCCSSRARRAQRRVRGDAQATSARPPARIDCTFAAEGGADALRAGARPHPPRGRGGGARAAASHIVLTDEHVGAERARAADDPGRRRACTAPGAPGAAHLHLAQRALGRMPRHALFRGADRRRRHDGQRLPGPGDASPTAIARGLFGELTLERVPAPTTRRRSTRAC